MAQLESGTFAPHVGSRFDIAPATGDAFAATLTRCDVTAGGDPADWIERIGRVPFTLLFHAPAGTDAPQQTFAVRHPDLGELSLFLVPLGPDERGARYEAVIG
jgi:hypothetical protein